MTRLRKIGLVSLAVLIISVIVSQVAFADYVDASKNNDKLPKQYDYSLFKTGGYSVVDGYEDKAKQAADIQWRECLQQINYARNGAGWMGWGGWIYVDDEAHICRTYQASRNIALPFQTGYDISNIEPTHVMRALLAGNKFLKHTGSAYKYDEKQMKEAEKDLAGDAAAEAVERNGGGDVSQTVASEAAKAAVDNGASVDMVNAVTDPSGSLDKAMNQLKEDSGKAISQGLGYVSQGLSFSGALKTYRESYAAAAGVGLVLLAGSAVVSLVRLRRSGLPATEVLQNWSASLVLGFFGLVFTPMWTFVCTDLADTLSAGVVDWMGSSPQTITGSLLDPFHALTTANSPLGWLGAFVICILFFVAGVMLVVTFAIQYLVAYFGSTGLGVMWGQVTSEKGRRRLKIAIGVAFGAIFARPILLFMIGVAMKLSGQFTASADGWGTDPMGTLFRIVLGIGAILMVCFSPASLSRFMPVGGVSIGGHSVGGGLLGGLAGGSVAGSMMGSRMHSLASRMRGAGRRLGAGRGGGSRPGLPSGQRPGGRGGPGARPGAGGGPGRGPGGARPGGRSGSQRSGQGRGSTSGGQRGRHAAQPGTGAGGGGHQQGGGAGAPGGQPVGASSIHGGSQDHGASGSMGGPASGPSGAGPAGGPIPVGAGPAGGSPAGAGPAGPGASGGGSATQGRPSSPMRQVSPGSGGGSYSGQSSPAPRPGQRLRGADLAGAGRRAASGAVRAGGTVAAGAVAVGTVAASVGRVAGYEGANFARSVEEAGR